MPYAPKNFDHLLGTAGFSDTLLKNHFTLYGGYVTNTNTVADKLDAMLKAGTLSTPEGSELRRRFGWEWNGMRLHEYYFGNMKNGGAVAGGNIEKRLTSQYGSMGEWEKDFRATGTMRGIGWTILAHDREADRLFNVWVTEHDMGHMAGATPLLVLDVFEHAYMVDYALKKADYIEAFMKCVDWATVEKRMA